MKTRVQMLSTYGSSGYIANFHSSMTKTGWHKRLTGHPNLLELVSSRSYREAPPQNIRHVSRSRLGEGIRKD